jgi:hypothetical protein
MQHNGYNQSQRCVPRKERVLQTRLNSSILLCCAIAAAIPQAIAAKTSSPRKATHDDLSGEIPWSVRDSGPCWINYGPGIFESCRAVVYYEVLPASSPPLFNRYLITTKDDNFGTVRDWIKQKLENRINLSPAGPIHTAVFLGCDYILMFNSDNPPDTEVDEDLTPILMHHGPFKSPEIEKTFLLGFACFQYVHGESNKTFNDGLATIKAMMTKTCTRTWVQSRSNETQPNNRLLENGQAR